MLFFFESMGLVWGIPLTLNWHGLGYLPKCWHLCSRVSAFDSWSFGFDTSIPVTSLHRGSGTTPVGTSMRTYNVPRLPHCVDNFLAGQPFQTHCFKEMNHSFVKNEKKRAQIPSKQFRGFAAHITDIMLPAREHWIGLLTESINATL